MNLVLELKRLADSVGGGEASEVGKLSFASVAERIAQNLAVRPHEVAIMGVSIRWRHLYFIVPETLKNVGFIPLSSKSALAARTTREASPEIINDFASVKHASVFEGVKSDELTASVIQRILSAPISADGKVIGVIQVSRKAQKLAEAGPEFTSEDLRKLQAICAPLGKLIQYVLTD